MKRRTQLIQDLIDTRYPGDGEVQDMLEELNSVAYYKAQMKINREQQVRIAEMESTALKRGLIEEALNHFKSAVLCAFDATTVK